jgi:hypothetical protein
LFCQDNCQEFLVLQGNPQIYQDTKSLLKRTSEQKPQEGALHRRSRPPVFIERVNRVEMLILLLPHGRQREFGAEMARLGLLF